MRQSIDVGASNLVKQQAGNKAGRIVYNLLIISIILATLPIGTASSIFSAIALGLLLVLIYCCKKHPGLFLKKSITAIILTTALSVTVGCSPLLEKLNSDVLSICEEAQGGSCKSGISRGMSIFGYPFSNADIEMAKAAGGIEKVFGTELSKGHGLVSITRIVVYGG
jgi:hypothetical protein